MSAANTHHRSCNLCEAMCGITISVEDQKITSIKGDPDDPFSRGHICPKAVALKDLYDDPDRLRTPLEKRDGEWHPISWDEALDKAAAGIKRVQSEYGHNSVGAYLGNPNAHNLGSLLMGPPLLRALKTRNRFSATSVDQLPHHLVSWKLFGHQLRIPVPDIDRCDHFVMLGANPLASNGSIMSVPDVKKRLRAVSERGRVTVIDPRRSETANIADVHHFIRPGSDATLLLAMLNHLFESGQVRPGVLSAYLDTDPQSLQAYFAPWSAERAEAATGIAAASIRQLVDDFCAADAAVLYGRMGVSVQAFGTLCQYLIMLFNILTGRLDAPGGLMFTTPAANILAQTNPGSMGRFHSRVRKLPEFGGELPVSTLAEDILTPSQDQDDTPIRAMFLIAGNPVVSTPNGDQLNRALASLDFVVSIDFYINESNRHADIILPPVSPVERAHYDLIFHLLAVRNTARYCPPLFDKPAEARYDWEILLALQERLAPAKTIKDKLGRRAMSLLGPTGMVDLLLRNGPYGAGFKPFGQGLSISRLKRHPHGVDLGPLKPMLPDALHHKDGKIHLDTAFFLADLQRVEETFAQPSAHKMVLIGRRHVRSNNSWLHNSHRLVKGKPRCVALIHPNDAERLGLAGDSARVKVRSRVGELEVSASISDEVMPGVISIPHGWGHDKDDTSWKTAQAHAGVNLNTLTDDQALDKLSGNAALNGIAVHVQALA